MTKTKTAEGSRLMKAIVGGGVQAAAAMAEINHNYRDRVIGYIINRQKVKWGRADPEAAKDIASDTMVRVFEAAPRYHGGKFEAFVFETAEHVIQERSRNFVRKWRLMKDLARERRFCGVGSDIVVEAVNKLGDLKLDSALETLKKKNPERYEAVQLRVVEERKYREIAEIMGCKEATARTRVHRGLKDLYSELVTRWKEDHKNVSFF